MFPSASVKDSKLKLFTSPWRWRNMGLWNAAILP